MSISNRRPVLGFFLDLGLAMVAMLTLVCILTGAMLRGGQIGVAAGP